LLALLVADTGEEKAAACGADYQAIGEELLELTKGE
jgi:hypothetical protein